MPPKRPCDDHSPIIFIRIQSTISNESAECLTLKIAATIYLIAARTQISLCVVSSKNRISNINCFFCKRIFICDKSTIDALCGMVCCVLCSVLNLWHTENNLYEFIDSLAASVHMISHSYRFFAHCSLSLSRSLHIHRQIHT